MYKRMNKNIKLYLIVTIMILGSFILVTEIRDKDLKKQILQTDITVSQQKLKEEDMDYILTDLKKNKQYTEIEFIEAFHLLKSNKLEEAKNKLEKVISITNENEKYLTKVYAYKYLAIIAKEQCNYDKFKLYIMDSFKSINAKYYDDSINIIIGLVTLCQDYSYLRNTGIEILNEVSKSKEISDESKLIVLDKLSLLYFMNYEYSNSSEVNLNYIFLAKSMGKQKEYATGIVYLSTLFRELNGNITALEAIEKSLEVEIDNEKDRAMLEAYAYLNLGEVYVDIDMYEEALKEVSKVEKYKKYYSDEDYRDFEILSNLIKIECYMNTNKIDEAEKLLKETQRLLKIDKNKKFINKDIEYFIINAQYLENKKKYNEALKEYEKALELSGIYGSIDSQEVILEEMSHIFKEIKDIENYNYSCDRLEAIKEYSEDLRYEDYSKYIIHSTVDKKRIAEQYNMKINLYKLISIILLILILVYLFVFKKFTKMKKLTQIDGLTNVYNRREFDKAYLDSIDKRLDFVCVMLDIDNFKIINDVHGHSIGDEVIVKVCKTIESVIDKQCKLYRYGGEEFVLLIYDKTDAEMLKIIEEVRVKVSDLIFGEDINVTISLGAARFTKYGNETLINADINLYEAKNTGKNKIIYK